MFYDHRKKSLIEILSQTFNSVYNFSQMTSLYSLLASILNWLKKKKKQTDIIKTMLKKTLNKRNETFEPNWKKLNFNCSVGLLWAESHYQLSNFKWVLNENQFQFWFQFYSPT